MLFSTRSGVRSRPLRAGSSPMRCNISRTISARVASLSSLSPVIFHVVARCLPEHEPLEGYGVRELRLDPVPDADHQVLGRRIDTGQPRHIQVQIAMVDV